MGYGSKSLNDLRDEAHEIAVKHGFKDASVGEDLALMHSELSEALEDFRSGSGVAEVWYEENTPAFDEDGDPIVVNGKHAMVSIRHASNADGMYKPCGIPSEISDVIIRALHFAGKHGIDIEQAVREKMLYNETRSHKHGGKKL